jgi:hypothetical protein
MYNVVAVKVSVVGISCFSGLRLVSGYSLTGFLLLKDVKTYYRLNFG